PLGRLAEQRDDLEEPTQVKRLRQDEVGGGLKRPEPLLGLAGEHHHWKAITAVELAQALEDLEAADVGQAEVEEDEVWALAGDRPHAVEAGARGDELEARFAREQHVDELQARGVV